MSNVEARPPKAHRCESPSCGGFTTSPRSFHRHVRCFEHQKYHTHRRHHDAPTKRGECRLFRFSPHTSQDTLRIHSPHPHTPAGRVAGTARFAGAAFGRGCGSGRRGCRASKRYPTPFRPSFLPRLLHANRCPRLLPQETGFRMPHRPRPFPIHLDRRIARRQQLVYLQENTEKV